MKYDKDGNPIEEEDDVIDKDEGDEEDDDLEVDISDDEDNDELDDKKSRNTAFAKMRIQNKELKDSVAELSTQIAGLNRTPAAPAAPAAPAYTPPVPTGEPQTDAEWDALAEKDWKKAVDLRSSRNAQTILAKQQSATKAENSLLESKQKVLSFHPELNDNASEKSKIFLNILDTNPDYLTHPKGPIYAMRDMEDYMETVMGYKRNDIRSAEKTGAQREVNRQNRIVLNNGAGRTNTKSKSTVTLDKDEMEFCKFHSLDPKEYARNKKKLSKSNKSEGVSV